MSHITVIINSQVIVNLQYKTFGLECLGKTPAMHHYSIHANEVSVAVYRALKQLKTTAKVVVADEDGEYIGAIAGMQRMDGSFRLAIRPMSRAVKLQTGRKA